MNDTIPIHEFSKLSPSPEPDTASAHHLDPNGNYLDTPLLAMDPQDDGDSHRVITNDWQLIWFLLSTTAHWVMGGIFFMFAGIIILRFVLLPRMYTCPPGAVCPHSIDPRGETLRLIQTVMLYWLRAGCLIAGVGLFKAIAYHGWFLIKTHGLTIGTLELSLATIHGSAFDAAVLIWRRRHIALALFALGHLGIFTLVPLVVNHSISDLRPVGRVRGTFTYWANFTFPQAWTLASATMFSVDTAIDAWLYGDAPFDDYHGTFVIRDNRTFYALDAQPTGLRISGRVYCSGENVSSVVLPPNPDHIDTWYNLTYGDQWVIHVQNQLASSFMGRRLGPILGEDGTTISLELLWVSNMTGWLSNTTTTSDGLLQFTHCVHTLDTLPIADEHRDFVQPSRYVPQRDNLCTGIDEDTCLRAFLATVVLTAWRALNERQFRTNQLLGTLRYCQRGALTGLPDQHDEGCVVNDETWTSALAIIVESVLRASEKQGLAQQDLWVGVESISRSWWWLQGIIPVMVFLLYVACAVHVFNSNRGPIEPGQLSVSEVVSTAVPDQTVQDYVRRGKAINGLTVGGHAALAARTDESLATPLLSLEYNFTVLDTPIAETEQNDGRDWTSTSSTTQKARQRFILLLLNTTAYPVLAGIAFMIMGIAILRFALLPRIYTCPDGAACPDSYDPNGPVLRVVQTGMIYWLQTGCLISGIGLVKVIAYHAWFVMTKRGRTIKTLGLQLEAIHGGIFSATLLLLKHSQKFMPLVALLQVAISTGVALVVDQSISRLMTTGRAKVQFTYPGQFALPNVVLPGVDNALFSYKQTILDAHTTWLLGDNISHPYDQYSNTLVLRDNRTALALDAQPGGFRVSGAVTCSGVNVSSVLLPSPPGAPGTAYNVTFQNRFWVVHLSTTFLAGAFLDKPLVHASNSGLPVAAFLLLWISTDQEIIPNSAASDDGVIHYAVCAHTVGLVPIPDRHLDHVQPTSLFIPSDARNGSDPVCANGKDDNTCLALIIANYFFFLAGGTSPGSLASGQLIAYVRFCVRGAISIFGDPLNRDCRIDTGTWLATLAPMVDALLRTGDLRGNTTQELWVDAESISRRQWWLQALIPCATFLVYVAAIGRVAYLDRQHIRLKELSLSEIIAVGAINPWDVSEHVKEGLSLDSVRVGGTDVQPSVEHDETPAW